MLPFRPLIATSRRPCSFSVMSARMLTAFSAPLGCIHVSKLDQQTRCNELSYAKLNGDGEEVDTGLRLDLLTAGDTREVDIAGLNKALSTLGSLEQLLGKPTKVMLVRTDTQRQVSPQFSPVAGISHGESGGAKTVLGLDNLITAELDTVHERIVLVIGDRDRRGNLAEERDNGLSRVTANDRDGQLLGVGFPGDFSNEGLGTDNVEGGNTEEALGVEDALGLEDLGGNRDSRVDGVGDDEDEGLGGDLGSDLDEALDDTGVDVEQIVTGHSGLACRRVSDIQVEVASNGSLRGMPAGMTMMSASLKAVLAPSLAGR